MVTTMNHIFLDNAATTPICEAAKQVILENLDNFYNPSSSYENARQIKVKIEEAREKIASIINAKPDEIYFTSGGSESNTWAMCRKISIASNIEHSSLNSNFIFNVQPSGIVDLKLFENKVKFINNKTQLDIASCQTLNNEIGTIQPIKELCEITHSNGILFHTDAVQAIGHIPIDVKELGVDMMSGSAHKFGGIKGCGFLYIKNGKKMPNLIRGGKQERGMRPGTENVIGILAMAAALEWSVNNMSAHDAKITYLSSILKENLLNIKGVHLNGTGTENIRYYGNLNLRIDGVKGSDIVAMADQFRICISAGSACHEGNAQPSHVLKAIGLTDEESLSSIRITLGPQNTEEEINYVCNLFPKIIDRLRKVG